jgi:alkanesulfonate monooxygenase SsuD/methylene tetrahydromethanopterin reductase-like flavin-dependent oxidoreductase (luciferase family)
MRAPSRGGRSRGSWATRPRRTRKSDLSRVPSERARAQATRLTSSLRPSRSSVGVGITPFHTDDNATIRLAVAAEELGYARFGAAEGWTHDAVVLLARIAGVTSRIGLATAVLPVWSRTPAAIAMAAASLQRASEGRFALGLGASSPPLVEGLHGLTWQQPVSRMRNTLVAVRALLDGARLPLDSEGVRPLRLGAAPERRIPILLAALAPSSIRLAGELADDWLPFLWARSKLHDGRALLAEGEAAGERSTATGVAASVPLAIAQDDKTARQIAAGWLLAYLTRMGPLYPRMLRDYFGYAREVDALLEANGSGDRPRLPATSERLARDVTVMGTYDEAPDEIRRWLEGGADTVDLVLPLGLGEERLIDMLEAAAPS